VNRIAKVPGGFRPRRIETSPLLRRSPDQAEVDARTLRNIALVNALNEDWAAKQALQQALQQTKEVTP
jgi:hypothetical protein